MIFADAWPGKYDRLDETLALLAPGGLYIVDDLLPQKSWPPGHENAVAAFVSHIRSRPDIRVTALDWASGLLLVVKAV